MSFTGILLGLLLIWLSRYGNFSFLRIIGFVIVAINSVFFLLFILVSIGSIVKFRAIILGLAVMGVYFYISKKKRFSKEIEDWKNRNYLNNRPEEFIEIIKAKTKKMGNLSLLDIPIGRAIYFSQSADSFVSADAEADFIVYHGESSKDEKKFSFKEYGYLITSESIYYRKQWKNNFKWEELSLYIPFSGAYKLEAEKVYYADKKTIDLSVIDERDYLYLREIIDEAIDSGYTHNMFFSFFSDDSIWEKLVQDSTYDNSKAKQKMVDNLDVKIRELELEKQYFEKNNNDPITKQKISDYFDEKIVELKLDKKYSIIGGLSAASLNSRMAHEAQLNQMLSGKQGHGVAAEWGNTVVDRALGKTAQTQVGGMNAKYGADRSVNGTKIQTKYYQTINNGNVVPGDARATISSYVNNIEGYFNNGVRQVEVPRDQYLDGLKRMSQAIKDGKIPGEVDPANAHKYVRKGFWKYDQAHAIARSGTIPSLTVDILGGVQCAIPGAGIAAIITYWNARSNGLDQKEARNLTIGVFSKSMLVGTLTYAGTMQLSKKITEKGGKQAASRILARIAGESAEATFKKINVGLMLVMQVGPSLANTISGRSSGADLGTTIVTTGGGIGGAIVGQLLVPIPGVGMTVGAIIGSIAGGSLGSYVGKMIFGESTQTKMMKILKQELIDVVYTSPLNNEEINDLIEKIFKNKKMKRNLGLMYASINPRAYARDTIVIEPMIEILQKRTTINENEYKNIPLALNI